MKIEVTEEMREEARQRQDARARYYVSTGDALIKAQDDFVRESCALAAFVTRAIEEAETALAADTRELTPEEIRAECQADEAAMLAEQVEAAERGGSMSTSRKWMVYTVRERPGQEKAFWMKVGVAFLNADGSFNLHLDATPLDGKLHMRPEETPCAE